MRSLFNICLNYVTNNLKILDAASTQLPHQCTEWLLEWISCHDRLCASEAQQLLLEANFVHSLRRINFYLTDQLTDELLKAIGQQNKCLEVVTIVFCANITNRGIRAITQGQAQLTKLELRGLKHLTSYGIAGISTERLRTVDLSECPSICSSGVIQLVTHNKQIQRLALNGCTAVDDIALYAIGGHLQESLVSLELDFLENLVDPVAAISYVTKHCPNIVQLSLCRYFEPLLLSDMQYLNVDCKIVSTQLRELDLFGNYFSILPSLPQSIVSLRMSCNGMENVDQLLCSLRSLAQLESIRITLTNRDYTEDAVKQVNDILERLFMECGSKITGLQVMAYQLKDKAFRNILDFGYNLSSLSMDVVHISNSLMTQLFGEKRRATSLRVVKLHRMKLPHRILALIGKNCTALNEIETSFMDCVDDRFLKLLAGNCRSLNVANLNGCKWITDKGLCELARHCPLKEIRVRGTAVTDKCVHALASFCHDLEWIAHADYSGRPKFSEAVLKKLRESCNARVIC